MSASEKNDSTQDTLTVRIDVLQGNDLFVRATAAIGIDHSTCTLMLTSVLNTIGTTPNDVMPDELGVALPEIDRRLRALLLPEQADAAMRRLYQALMECQG